MSDLLTQWRSDGCVTLPALLDSGRATRIRTLCDHVLAQWSACDPQTGQPGAKPDATVMRHLNHPAYFTQRPAELA